MRKGREIVGMPVVSLVQAARVGIVRDLGIDLSRRALVSLLLAETGRQQPSNQVSFENVRRIGSDAIMIEDGAALTPVPEQPQFQTLLEGPSRLVGLQVITEGGRTVGTVSDLLVDEQTGTIEQYQISAGPLRDLFSGKITVSASVPRAVGREYIIVPEAAVLGRRAQLEAGPPLALESPPGPFMGLPEEEIEQVAADLVIQQGELILGQRARKTVANDEPGGVICFEGEPISEEVIERARAVGKLNRLVDAAGEAAMLAMSRSLAERYARLAVGEMAGRTVRTTEGEVLVSQGDVVTPESVDRAREAGVLDQLNEAVRAAGEGAAGAQGGRGTESTRMLWDRIGERVGRIRGRS